MSQPVEALPALARTGHWIGGISILGCGLAAAAWLALAPLNGAVVAQGTVKVAGDRKEVQHVTGGTVHRIVVTEGDTVAIGAPLIVLGDEHVSASLEGIDIALEALRMKRLRLEAEAKLADTVEFPQAGTQRMRELVSLETGVFQARRHALIGQRHILAQQEGEIDKELRTLYKLEASSNGVRQITKREEALNRSLRERGFISEMRVAQLEKEHLQSQIQQTNYEAETVRARQRREDIRLRRATLEADYAKQANEELREANAQLLRLEEDRRPLKDAELKQTLRAPVEGVVINLKVKTPGAVIAPGAPVLEIVPRNQPLVVEAHVHPEQIADVTLNQAASLHLTAYSTRKVPRIDGRVIYIGADRLEDNITREAYYLVRTSVEPASLAHARAVSGEPVALAPGMGAEVFITTRARSALTYLLDPILQGINRSMREH